MNDPSGIPTPEPGLAADGRQRISEIGGAAKERALSQADQRKSQLSRELSSLSQSLRQGRGSEEGSIAGNLVGRGADLAERAARTLESRSTEELIDDLKGQLRERPAIVLGGFFAAGFLAARLLR